MGFELLTERLRLREMTAEDLDFVASMLADSQVMKFYPQVYSRDEARAWLERQLVRYAERGHGLWLVEDRRTFQPVGQVGLVLQELPWGCEPEIGYLIHRPFWRRGYATEAARAVRDHAFESCGMNRVISLIRPINEPSQGVARKLGMQVERETEFKNLQHLVFTVGRHSALEITSAE